MTKLWSIYLTRTSINEFTSHVKVLQNPWGWRSLSQRSYSHSFLTGSLWHRFLSRSSWGVRSDNSFWNSWSPLKSSPSSCRRRCTMLRGGRWRSCLETRCTAPTSPFSRSVAFRNNHSICRHRRRRFSTGSSKTGSSRGGRSSFGV